jgi:hypothetical protein
VVVVGAAVVVEELVGAAVVVMVGALALQRHCRKSEHWYMGSWCVLNVRCGSLHEQPGALYGVDTTSAFGSLKPYCDAAHSHSRAVVI